jgi:hypothetical protein
MVTNEFQWGVKPEIPAHWRGIIHVDQFDIELCADRIEARAKDEGEINVMQANAEAIVEGIACDIGLDEKAPYRVRLASRSQSNSDTGQRSATVFIPTPTALKLSMGRAEVVVVDSSGTVLRDSRAERFDRLSEAAYKIAGDERLQRIIGYLFEYYEDPNKRLAPLFDIIEFVAERLSPAGTRSAGMNDGKKKLGRENKKRKAAAISLGIPFELFNDVGNIANNRNIRISRHRGLGLGPQRDPTEAEREKCERLAETIIERFKRLEKEGPSGFSE